MSTAATVKHLILVGGGHAHALFLNKLHQNPIPNLSVTLISPDRETPYSGMLPGFIAGHYQYEDIHIDLKALSLKVKIEFILGRVNALSPEQKQVTLECGKELHYDLISFDTGATPSTQIEGSKGHAISVKPIGGFYKKWTEVEDRLNDQSNAIGNTLSVIGSGAAGIEVILAIKHRFDQLGLSLNYQLVSRGTDILEGYPVKLRNHIHHRFQETNIELVSNFNVTQVTHSELLDDQHRTIPSQVTIICTNVKGAPWLSNTGLELSEQGFIKVQDTLQSISYPEIFAVGDVCHFTSDPLPKAGVYAVRMSQVLYQNIKAVVLDTELQRYNPQSDFLSLLACGDKTAVGSKKGFTIKGKWVWRLKNYIDLKFMKQFNA